ncbi:MAG: Gfo/Idh/MocA family oxidoreductase [Pirellulaceae bacterium]|nr:Gfo/Idh/MocA family oxidoreductase [Pirellulaceae bacterium]
MTEHRSLGASRRSFLKRSAVVASTVGMPSIVPASALGLGPHVAPSNRIALGFIGTGGKGRHNMGQFLGFDDCQVAAVCDVDSGHLQTAKAQIDKRYGNNDCLAVDDFRELASRDDLDAICVSTPDHWHALATIAALNGGKDVYCEKPLANSVAEGRAICRAAALNDRIVQTGSHERSGESRRHACELVRNGRIGKLHTIRINLPTTDAHHLNVKKWLGEQPEGPAPDGLDWQMWLGHTPDVPFTEKRCHFWWRFILAYGGGEMTDRGAHVIDLAQLGAGKDDTGPVECIANGTQNPSGIFDAYMDYVFVNVYDDGLKMIGSTKGPRGVKFEGDEGWIFIHVHDPLVEASDPRILESKIGRRDIQLGRSPGHHRNFIDCMKSRQEPLATAEIGHRTGSICHLNNISMKLGRPIRWDPVNEVIIDDEEANALLAPRMREPWSL